MVRISGVVKTADRVKRQLQQGIDPTEIDSLKAFVCRSLDTIENICTEANDSPDRLPIRSRKAYYYLKNIDWQNLPLTKRSPAEPTPIATVNPARTLRISNLVKTQKQIQKQLGQLPFDYSDSQLELIRQVLRDRVQEVDRICQENKLTPAALTTPSRKAYAWMKFLTDNHNLKAHIGTTHKIKNLTKATLRNIRSSISEIQVTITNYTGLYKYKQNRQGQIELQLSEGFIQAEDSILESIIRMIVKGSNPQDKHLLRDFGTTERYREITLELDLIADLDAEVAQGKYYDLEVLFDSINQEYFAGDMVKPRLTWNKVLTHRKLGHYEPLRDRVVMSRSLDNSSVPQMVVELVLYHELLHKYHGAKWLNGKRMEFQHYQAAQQWIERSFSMKA